MKSVFRKAVIGSVLIIGVTAAFSTAQGRGGRGGGGGGAAATASAAAPAAQAAPADGFPPGDVKKLVLDNCGGCHDLDTVKNAKHDQAAWTETVTHMVNYGASLTDVQVPTVAAYLAKSFPVAGAKTDDAAKKEDPDAAGERILNTACSTCHDLGPITRRNDDRAAWESVVYGMVGNGADVKDADIPILVDYLFKNYGPPKEAPKTAAPAAPPARGGNPPRGAAPAGR